MISHIHHVNFLVKDLDQAVARYESVLGEGVFQYDKLEQRAVKIARTKLGQTWFILVQPVDQNSIPAKHLAEHGEGFFLLSLATNDLASEQQRIENDTQTTFTDPPFSTPVRTGLDDWQVVDFDINQLFGAQLQLTEDVENR